MGDRQLHVAGFTTAFPHSVFYREKEPEQLCSDERKKTLCEHVSPVNHCLENEWGLGETNQRLTAW